MCSNKPVIFQVFCLFVVMISHDNKDLDQHNYVVIEVEVGITGFHQWMLLVWTDSPLQREKSTYTNSDGRATSKIVCLRQRITLKQFNIISSCNSALSSATVTTFTAKTGVATDMFRGGGRGSYTRGQYQGIALKSRAKTTGQRKKGGVKRHYVDHLMRPLV